ncbi:hypothetical protein [Sporosarcina trichiuri]|uniref:hypothetical protein n=1 Tax=Sporosarcina trichiuri TaxID=3056445 RepID=UPI0025B2FD67|nr:hypothetical protein [Sporosarcina sp. 0.2-SM1T-5]WJY26430.1 hypothetical protein QWT68_10085 [Sporosarcina sp. 0.2-SM1T-5]
MRRGVGVLVILAVICAAGVIGSWMVWKGKVQEAGELRPAVSNESGDTGNSPDAEPNEEETVTATPPLDALGESVDPGIRKRFEKRFAADEPVRILLAGSDALAPVAVNFAEKLKTGFGEWVTVDAATADVTSSEFIAQGLGTIDWSAPYDVVIYEPFTLKNNGKVVIEKEEQDLLAVYDRASSSSSETVFIVTPPQPIYEANYYLTQIEALQKFSAAKNFLYVDHWDRWPTTSSADLLEYVGKDRTLTSKGVDVWAEALAEQFID